MNRSHEHAADLLERATDDLRMLQRLAGDSGMPLWGIGFHAQQAVEKSLKAALACAAIEYPRTHDVALLLDLIAREGIGPPRYAQMLPGLTPFAVQMRYPHVPAPTSLPGNLTALALCEQVRDTIAWARRFVDSDSQRD